MSSEANRRVTTDTFDEETPGFYLVEIADEDASEPEPFTKRLANAEARLFANVVAAGRQAIALAENIDPIAQSPELSELTKRELQIAELIGKGLRTDEIARQLFKAVQTVKFHKTHIFSKLRTSSQVGVASVVHEAQLNALEDQRKLFTKAGELMVIASDIVIDNTSLLADDENFSKQLKKRYRTHGSGKASYKTDEMPPEPLKEFSARELDVLGLLSLGLTNKEIGSQMHLSKSTVKYNITNIFKKLKLNNRVQTAQLVYESEFLKWAARVSGSSGHVGELMACTKEVLKERSSQSSN